MPFREKIWDKPATQGDVSMIALKAGIGLNAVAGALIAIQDGRTFEAELSEVERIVRDLDKIFDELSGWYSDDEG